MADEPKRPTVVVPAFCERHRRDLVVRRLKLTPTDAWREHESTGQLLMLKGLLAHDHVLHARSEGTTENLTMVLAEIGCLACWRPRMYQRVYRVLLKGLNHAKAIISGDVADPEFPL